MCHSFLNCYRETAMTPEALWSLEFIDNRDHSGGGIAVLYKNRVLGGNASFTYIGEYKFSGEEIIFKVDVRRFNDYLPGLYKDEFRLVAKGKYHDLDFIVTGSPEDDDNMIMAVQLTRQGEIP